MSEASLDAARLERVASVPGRALLDIALVMAAAAMAMWPAFSADYADDYYFAAMSRTAASPLEFFVHGHFFTGCILPPAAAGAVVVVDRVAALPAAHYVLNAVLLGACGTALYLLMRAYGVLRALAVCLAVFWCGIRWARSPRCGCRTSSI